jgi:hypothetical protein
MVLFVILLVVGILNIHDWGPIVFLAVFNVVLSIFLAISVEPLAVSCFFADFAELRDIGFQGKHSVIKIEHDLFDS